MNKEQILEGYITDYQKQLEKHNDYAFTVEINRSGKQFYANLIAKNGETVYTGESIKRRSTLIKTLKNLFPGVEIKDNSQETKKSSNGMILPK